MDVSPLFLSLTPVLSYDKDTRNEYNDKSIPRTFELPLELPSTPVDPNDALVEELKGKVMRIPNMLNYMEGWPVREVNQHQERIRILFNEALDR